MKFLHPEVLYALPVLILAGWILRRWFRQRTEARVRVFAGPVAGWNRPGFDPKRQALASGAGLVAMIALAVAIARPLIFRRTDQSEMQGIPYLIVLDVSRSMLATDVRPSRFSAATNAIDRYLGETTGDRIGLVSFSGVAYLNAPLTFDMNALRSILRYLNPEDYIDPGSSLTAGLERASRYFASNNIPQRIAILISDGEDLEGRPVETARRLHRDQGLRVCTIGVGTSAGARVPLGRAGLSATNTFGQQATTRLNEGNLERLANAAGGRYYRMGANGEGMNLMRREFLGPLAETAARENLNNYREFVQVPGAIAILALLVRLFAGADRYSRLRTLTEIAGLVNRR